MSEIVDISDRQLVALAGQDAYDLGLDYYHRGCVRSWSRCGDTITAEVDGSALYQVSLRYNSRRFEGSCTCPASDGFDFCKHCVAATLAWRTQSNRQARLLQGTAEQRLEAYLSALDKNVLIEQLLELIHNDPLLAQHWSIKADLALNRLDSKALKKRITAAIPFNRSLFRAVQVRAYFATVEELVDLLQQQLDQLDDIAALGLVDYALQRLERALETIDDSGGLRMRAEDQLQGLHRQVLKRLDWDSEQLVDYLLAIAAGPCRNRYGNVPHDYADVLGEAGLNLVFMKLQVQWDALLPLPAGASWEEKADYVRLQQLLVRRARELGQAEQVIALREKTATSERDFLDLCQLCIDADELTRAEYWLMQAQKQKKPIRNPWQQDLRRQRLRARLLELQARPREALEQQWEVFQLSLKLSDYEALLVLADQTGNRQDYVLKAHTWLRARLTEGGQGRFTTEYSDALLSLYLHTGNLDEALLLAQQFRIGVSHLEKLAAATQYRPQDSIPLRARLAGHRVQEGNNAAYRRALDDLKEAASIVVEPADRHLFESTLDDLRRTHKAKRNFIKLLSETFSS